MNPEDIKELLLAVNELLRAVQESSVFQELAERDDFYTMNDVTIGDAIQAVGEVAQGIDNLNHEQGDENLNDRSLIAASVDFIAAVGKITVRAYKNFASEGGSTNA